jgi:hypothetical protein
VGCGDDDGSGGASSCAAFQACGGEVEGNWNVEDVCFDDIQSLLASSLDESACDGLFRGAAANATGTSSFANGTGSIDLMLSIDVEARWTEACVSALNNGAEVDITQACPMIEANYLNQGQFEGAACMLEGQVCSCMLTSPPMPVHDAGGYRIEGNALIDDSDGSSTPYCVQGDTLTLDLSTDELGGTVTLRRM